MTIRRLRFALPLAFVVLLTDCTTKELVVETLAPYTPHDVVGEVVRLTLVYNPQAAMGLPLGALGRWPLILLGCVLTTAVLLMLWRVPARDSLQRLGFGLVLGGALGNLVSRVRYPRGVVDFVDIGFGDTRFYIFNVADVAVCLGATLIILTLWRTQAPPDMAARNP